MSRKLLEGLWKSEKTKLKESLPKTKKPLTFLLNNPVIELNNGEESVVFLADLEIVERLLPDALNNQLMLPFIFKKKKSQYHLLGDKLEHWVIDSILGLTNSSAFLLEVFKTRSYFVYHFKQVQAKIPTLVFLTFQIT